MERLKDHIKGTDGVADMVKWYNWTTFDIIGDLLYGEPFDCLKNAEYHPWLAVVLQNIRLSSYIALMERYSFLKKLVMALLPQNLLEKRNMHLDVIRDKCRRHDGKGTDHSIVGSIDPANASLTEGELEANLALMTMAGSETSATTMSAATYYLATNETAASKVAEEIRSAFKGELDISWAAVQKLPYLNAVIKETLRLYPPTPVGLPRRVISKGETVIGHFIPKDVSLTNLLLFLIYLWNLADNTRWWYILRNIAPIDLNPTSASQTNSGLKGGLTIRLSKVTISTPSNHSSPAHTAASERV